MFVTVNDFLNDWKQESASTLKILNSLSDGSLSQKVWEEGRSLGFIAWHIVLTLGEMGNKAGLAVISPGENAPPPKSASEISAAYANSSKSLLDEVSSKWDDEMLAGEIEMYSEKWTRGMMLGILIKHEIHHRAQITILMRQAGIKVPGVYGPSKEEWDKYGMEPMQ